MIVFPQHGLQVCLVFLSRRISGIEGLPVPFRRFVQILLQTFSLIAAFPQAEHCIRHALFFRRRGFRCRGIGKSGSAENDKTQTKRQDKQHDILH